jgi:hypothetical protein
LRYANSLLIYRFMWSCNSHQRDQPINNVVSEEPMEWLKKGGSALWTYFPAVSHLGSAL